MQKSNIFIKNDGSWIEKSGIYVRGGGFLDGEFKNNIQIFNILKDINEKEKIIELVSSINGFFAIIVVREDMSLAFVDHFRTIPLFYSKSNDNIIISNKVSALNKDNCNKPAKLDYILMDFCLQNDTLVGDINQIRAGEYLDFSNGSKSIFNYIDYETKTSDTTKSHRLDKLDEVMNNSIERLIKYADGRQIVIPLTGGHDSTLIASKLQEFGYDNLVSYTVKNWGVGDLEDGKRVADELNIEWLAPRATRQDWSDFYYSNDMESYRQSANYASSLPTYMDIVDLEILLKNDSISDSAVFVPGHNAADSTKFSHNSINKLNSIDEVTEYIMKPQEYLSEQDVTQIPVGLAIKDWDVESEIKEQVVTGRIKQSLSSLNSDREVDPANAVEKWRIKERLSKLIVNHIRTYDYLSVDWWLPLEDFRYLEFCKGLPADEKYNKSLYKEYVEDVYSSLTGNRLKTKSKTSKINQVKKIVSDSQIEGIVRPIYIYYKRGIKDNEKEYRQEYNSDPRYGIIDIDLYTEFKNKYGNEDWYSLVKLDHIGVIDLEKDDFEGIPKNGEFKLENI